MILNRESKLDIKNNQNSELQGKLKVNRKITKEKMAKMNGEDEGNKNDN